MTAQWRWPVKTGLIAAGCASQRIRNRRLVLAQKKTEKLTDDKDRIAAHGVRSFSASGAAPVAISKYLRQIAFLPGRSRKLLQSQRRKSVRNCDS